MITTQAGFNGARIFLLLLYSLPLVMLTTSSCSDPSYDEGPFALDDEALVPFAAMYQVDRKRLCLTEIDRDSQVRIWRSDRTTRAYDIALRMKSDAVSRTAAFVWENDRYVWVGEQETHYSGRDYVSLDGELPEHITISYFERKTEGGPIGLSISYWGDDRRIPPDSRLTCDLALDFIEEWEARRMESDND